MSREWTGVGRGNVITRCCFGILIVGAALTSMLVLGPGAPEPAGAQGTGGTVVTATLPPPTRAQLRKFARPPAIPPDTLRTLQTLKNATHRPGPKTPPKSGAQAAPVAPPPAASPRALPASSLAHDFVSFTNTDFCFGVPHCGASVVAEPSAANNRSVVLETYNWDAALSSDRGNSFGFLEPLNLPRDARTFGVFCCDQSVVYDPGHDILIWVLLYVNVDNAGNYRPNTVRLAVANGEAGIANTDFHFTSLIPSDVGLGMDWFDYPHIELSGNYLFLSVNLFTGNVPLDQTQFDRTVVMRLPLDALAAHTAPALSAWLAPHSYFNATLTQGATTAMYWATHLDTSTLVVYRWSESSSAPDAFGLVPHSMYPWEIYTCPGPGGADWCGRLDDRVLTGWVSNGIIGFMWNAPGGASGYGFKPHPYIQTVLVNASTMDLRGESIMWGNERTYAYPGAGLNARGHVAGTLFYGSPTEPPTLAAFIWDDLTPANPYPSIPYSWELYKIAESTQGPDENKWGDFLTARSNYDPACSKCQYTWIATGYVLVGGGSNDHVRPRYLAFGRGRDNPYPTIYQFLPFIIK